MATSLYGAPEMPATHQRDENGIVVSRIRGRHSFADAVAGFQNVKSMVGSEENFEMVVHEFGAFTEMHHEEARELIDMVWDHYAELKRGAVAFVCANDFNLAIARKFQGMLEDHWLPVEVFDDEQTAYRWLHSCLKSQPVAP